VIVTHNRVVAERCDRVIRLLAPLDEPADAVAPVLP
jgi:hypothetical protein